MAHDRVITRAANAPPGATGRHHDAASQRTALRKEHHHGRDRRPPHQWRRLAGSAARLRRGVRLLLAGSEWPAVWDVLARKEAGGRQPRYINPRHEMVAVGVAAGYYRQTRRLSVVL